MYFVAKSKKEIFCQKLLNDSGFRTNQFHLQNELKFSGNERASSSGYVYCTHRRKGTISCKTVHYIMDNRLNHNVSNDTVPISASSNGMQRNRYAEKTNCKKCQSKPTPQISVKLCSKSCML